MVDAESIARKKLTGCPIFESYDNSGIYKISLRSRSSDLGVVIHQSHRMQSLKSTGHPSLWNTDGSETATNPKLSRLHECLIFRYEKKDQYSDTTKNCIKKIGLVTSPGRRE